MWSMACRLPPAGTMRYAAFTSISRQLSAAEVDIDGWPSMGGGQEKRREPEEENPRRRRRACVREGSDQRGRKKRK